MSSQCFIGTKPSKRHDTYSKKKQSRNKQKILLDRSADRRRRRLDEYIRTANTYGMLPNFGVTIVWHALQTAGDRREGHILGMQKNKRQEHFIRKLRMRSAQLDFKTIYIWVRSVGARMGEHIHIALFWPFSHFIELVRLMENVLGSDVDHETRSNDIYYARSHCRGWEIKPINGGLSGALRWGHYLAEQHVKHYDLSNGRSMGCSVIGETD